jgi:hypothetical protein
VALTLRGVFESNNPGTDCFEKWGDDPPKGNIEKLTKKQITIVRFCKARWDDELGERIDDLGNRGQLFGWFFEIVSFFSFLARGTPIGLLLDPYWKLRGSILAPSVTTVATRRLSGRHWGQRGGLVGTFR